MKKKDHFIGQCIDYTHDGLGVVKYNSVTVFVKNMIAGETALIEIIKVLKNYCVGRVIEFKDQSLYRQIPICDYYKQCGGCSLMHLTQEGQQDFKTRRVRETLERIGHLDVKVNDCLMDSNPYYYRNKVQVPVDIKDNYIISGFYKAHTNDIIDNNYCFIQNKFSNDVTAYVKEIMNKYHIMPYDKKNHTGMIRHILTRYGVHTDEGMLALISYTKDIPYLNNLIDEVIKKFPNIRTVILNINKRHDNVILGDEVIVLYGDGIIHDKLLGNDYQISLKSFYQINPRQVEVLYSKAIELADFNKDDIVLDAYCGIGTIGITLASKVKKVYGVEAVEQAIIDAGDNARRNHIDNIEFKCDDAGHFMEECINSRKNINVVIVDPPRKGCSEQFLDHLIQLSPDRVIYISCNVATQARDLYYLRDYYKPVVCQPVDMFPNTVHVETVAFLSKLDVDKHIDVEIKLGELDLTSAESKATYAQIKEYILEKFNLKVSTLYIAQIKKKCGIELREHYNKSKKEKQVIPQCTPEKEEAIMDALRHFKII